MIVQDWADAFVMPYMRAWSHEQSLAGLFSKNQMAADHKFTMIQRTAMDMRQIAHSDEWADVVSASSFCVGLPINRLWVATLQYF